MPSIVQTSSHAICFTLNLTLGIFITTGVKKRNNTNKSISTEALPAGNVFQLYVTVIMLLKREMF